MIFLIVSWVFEKLFERVCAGGGNRTPMDRSPADFESAASTNFTTSAKIGVKLMYINLKTREISEK